MCCRRALQMRRVHALVAHALVTGTPSQLGFGLLALYLVAKPVESSTGSQRFARFALASVIMGGCATAVSQSLGASGGVTGSGALVYACGAVFILKNPTSPVHLFYVARPFQASHVGAALVAWDSLKRRPKYTVLLSSRLPSGPKPTMEQSRSTLPPLMMMPIFGFLGMLRTEWTKYRLC